MNRSVIKMLGNVGFWVCAIMIIVIVELLPGASMLIKETTSTVGGFVLATLWLTSERRSK